MKFNKLLIGGLVLLFLTTQALATGINIFFKDDALKKLNDTTLTGPNYHPYGQYLQFFHNSLPAPNSVGTRLSVKVPPDPESEYTHNTGEHKYQKSSLSGGTLHVRVWDGAIAAQNSYYGKTSHGVASGTTLPYDWYITSLKTEYKCDVPYKPEIVPIAEALKRVEDDLELTLGISISYNPNPPGADGKREIENLSLHIVYPDDTEETLPGPSVNLTGTKVIAGTYKFTPTATNWFGSTQGDTVTYTTLGMGVAGPDTANYSFIKIQDSTGINTFPLAYTDFQNPDINNIKLLVEAINTQAGAVVVTAIGWWDAQTQQPAGYVIANDYDADTVTAYVGTAGLPADPAEVPFTRDMIIQISVIQSANFEVTGIR